MIEGLSAALILSAAFLGILVVPEAAVRRGKLSTDISRRLAHVLSGLFAVVMWGLFSPFVFLVCLLLLLAVITLSYAKNVLRSVHNVKRKTKGEIYLPLGVLVAFIVADGNPAIFIPAVLIMAFADTAAGVASDIRRLGRPSRAGSALFFGIAFAILIYFTATSVIGGLIIAGILTIAEKVSPFGSDNLTVPFAAAVLLAL